MKEKTKPLVTIITINYNEKDKLEKTIKSVINQTYLNKEYIIIDGDSQDGSKNILDKYKNYIDFFISEPDKGIYDAMNKGIKHATGDYIIFMNAGDLFYEENTIEKVFNKINNWKEVDLIYGNCYRIYNGISKIAKAKNLKNLWKGMVFSHQSLFAKSELLKKYPFNPNYTIAADFDFIFHMYTKGKKFVYINEIISIVDMEGLSNNKRIKSTIERWKIIKAYKKEPLVDIYYSWDILNILLKNFTKKVLPNKVINYIIKIKN